MEENDLRDRIFLMHDFVDLMSRTGCSVDAVSAKIILDCLGESFKQDFDNTFIRKDLVREKVDKIKKDFDQYRIKVKSIIKHIPAKMR